MSNMPLLRRLLSLTPQEDVYLFLNPVFVVRLVCLSISSVPEKISTIRQSSDTLKAWQILTLNLYLHKTAQICQVVNEVEQLRDVVCDGWTVWIHPLQMLLIHFANAWKRGAGQADWRLDSPLKSQTSFSKNGLILRLGWAYSLVFDYNLVSGCYISSTFSLQYK